MSNIIDNLLDQKSITDKLKDYIYISITNFDQVPLGSHIKFIDRNENVKSGGFLIKFVKNKDRTKCYYILKSNIIYKLYIYYFWVFYKEIKHESTMSTLIKSYKETLENNNDSTNESSKQSNIESQNKQSSTMNIIIKNNKTDKKNKKDKILLNKENKDKIEDKIENKDKIEDNIDDNMKADTNFQNKIKKNSKREAFLSLLNSLNKNN